MRKGMMTGILILVLSLLGVAILALYGSMKDRTEPHKEIVITGCKLLSDEDYLIFTHLNDLNDPVVSVLELPIIKDRFLKHPYVKTVSVEKKADKKVYVHITEKTLFAVISTRTGSFLLTEGREVLPIMQNTLIIDYPVITNSSVEIAEVFARIEADDVVEAFRIIETARLIDEELYKSLSDVNLRGGAETVLSFEDFNAFILFGKYNVTEKLLYINQLRTKKHNYSGLLEGSIYIDVRYADHIYIGRETNPEI